VNELFFHEERTLTNQDLEGRKVKKASAIEIHDMGLLKDNMELVSTIEELRNGIPNIVIAEGVKDTRYTQERFKVQQVNKKSKYVMSLGVYEQLHYNIHPQKDRFGREFSSKLRILKPAKIKFKNFYKPYIGQDLTDKTLLVFRTGGVGDLLFIQASLRYLKEKYPTCEVLFACGPQYQDMVKTWDCVDEVLDLPFNAKYLYNEEYKADYHAVFEGVIERCTEAQAVNAYILFSRWLGLDIPTEQLVPVQTADQEKVYECKLALEKLGVESLDSKRGDFIVSQLRASSPVRTPRPEVWISLINELTDRGHKIVITDVPRKKEIVDDVIKMCKNPDKVFNFCEYSKDVGYLIALTSYAKLALSCDTALMHIAESVGTKSFGIYGAFPGRIRLSTYKKCKWFECIIGCSPCYIHGQKPCFNSRDGYGICYDKLDSKYVSDRIDEHLENTGS
jgi:ADP-heptose:LPS heptosyltransferase